MTINEIKAKYILATAAVLLFIRIGANAQTETVDKIIGIVGDEIILKSDVETQYIQAQLADVKLSKCEVVESLLYNGLLINQANLDSLEVSDAQIENELDNRMRYFLAQFNSEKDLETFYGKTVEEMKDEFRPLIEEKIRVQMMRASITENVNVTPKEIKSFYKGLHADSIPLINARVEVAHIVVKPTITEEIKEETRERLRKFRAQILAGEEEFSTIATFYSEDPGTSSNGGEFDWVSFGTFVPQFDAQAKSLREGEISHVFETDYGYHIFELIERRGNQFKGRHILLRPTAAIEQIVEAKNRLDSIYTMIESNKIEFEAAALKYSDDEDSKQNGGIIYNTQEVSKSFDIQNINPEIFAAIRGLDVGDISKPMQFNTQDNLKAYRIVKLVRRIDPHKANLKEDYQLISNAALNEKKQKSINKWLEKTVQKTFVKIDEEYQSCDFEHSWISSF